MKLPKLQHLSSAADVSIVDAFSSILHTSFQHHWCYKHGQRISYNHLQSVGCGSNQYSDLLQARKSGHRILVGAKFSAHVQTSFVVYPASVHLVLVHSFIQNYRDPTKWM
jgi:hypothetical protein